GLIMSSFSVASVAGVPIGLWIAQAFSWHAAFYFICIVGVIFWVSAMLVLPSVKSGNDKKNFKENIRNFRSVLKHRDHLQCFSLTSILAFGIFMIIPFLAPYMVNNVGMKESELPY